MVNRELIEVFSEIAREKNVDRSELATILEELFLYIIEREYGDSSNCSCIVNLDKGEIEIYAEKTIVEEVDDYKVEITIEEAIEKEPEAAEGLIVGDIFVEIIDLTVFGRRIINTAKHFFAQKLRDVERNYIYEDYANRIGEIVIGIVHQVQRDNVFINIDQAELRLPKNEQIQSERYRRGDTVRSEDEAIFSEIHSWLDSFRSWYSAQRVVERNHNGTTRLYGSLNTLLIFFWSGVPGVTSEF